MGDKASKHRFGFFMRFVHLILIILAISLGAFLAVGYILGEDMPYIGWYYEFPMFIFGGLALVLTILFAVTRLRLLPIIPLAEIAFCIFMMQPRFNTFKPIPESTEILTVMTYNIMHATENLDDIKKVVQTANPDILFVQEFRGGEDGGRRFQDELFPGGEYSVKSNSAVFSKYHLKDAEWIDIYSQWSIQKVVAEIGDKEIILFNLHLPITVPVTKWQQIIFEDRDQSLERQKKARDILLKEIEGRKKPLIIAGDFNTLPHTIFIRKLQERILDTFLVSGSGFGNTFSTEYCLIRIDYIFLSQEFSVYSHEVLNEKASDHYPVVAKISLESEKKTDNSEQVK